MARKRKEKNISEKWEGNNRYLVIRIRTKDVKYSKTLSFNDFHNNEKAIWDEAKRLRDLAYFNAQIGLTTDTKKDVSYLFEKIFEWEEFEDETKRKYQMLYDKYIKEEFGDVPITKIELKDVQKTVNNCAKLTTHEWGGRLKTVWNKLFVTAKREKVRLDNPCDAIKVPHGKFKPKRPKEISAENYAIFMDSLWNYGQNEQELYRSHAVYYANTIMMMTGIRPAEAYSLKADDINLITGEINIERSLSSHGEIRRTKTASSVRVIPIPEPFKPELKKIIEWSQHEYLFQDYYGRFITTKDRSTLIKNVSKKCGVYFTSYMARHMFSTQMIKKGVPLMDVQAMMGHANSSMTLSYATSNQASRREAMELFAKQDGQENPYHTNESEHSNVS